MPYHGRLAGCGVNHSARSPVESLSVVRSNRNVHCGTMPDYSRNYVGAAIRNGYSDVALRPRRSSASLIRADIFSIYTMSGVRVMAAEPISIGAFSPRISARTLRNCALPAWQVQILAMARRRSRPTWPNLRLMGASLARPACSPDETGLSVPCRPAEKTITGSGNPSAGISAWRAFIQRGRPNPQMRFSRFLVLFLFLSS